jgi:hypothetical protein
MKKEINKLLKTYDAYEKALEDLEVKVREVCDFNARITFCAGDRHLVINEETSDVAPLWCLNGKDKDNKLSEEEHKSYCV